MKIQTVEKILLLLVIMVVTAMHAFSIEPSDINAQEAAAPSIKIILPRDDPGSPNIPGEALAPVLVEISNFKLVEPGRPNAANEGHIHYYLDFDPLAEPDKTAIFASGRFAESSETIHYWPDIGRGPHTFRAELVNNDHTPLNPRTIARSRISAGGYSEG